METKEVNKAYVHYSNDPSVGMFAYGYELEIFLNNPNVEELAEARAAISNLYELLDGEKPDSVRFDFELKMEAEAEAEMDKRNEELYEQFVSDREVEAEMVAEKENEKILIEKDCYDGENFFERANQRAIRSMI